jgi:DNA-binding NtrC family response regulator
LNDLAFSRARVLVIDDDHDIRTSLKSLLEVLGFHAEATHDGAAALELQRARNFGVVITDLFMSGTEGIETIAAFKATWPRVRVIAMSGGGEVAKNDYLDVARHIGADATLRKPFSARALLDALDVNEPGVR